MKLKVGDKAPPIYLLDQTGKQRDALAESRTHWRLVYFYPKDDTPGCTKEACGIRDNFPKFGKLDIVVYGISCDKSRKHEAFAKKYDLPFTLLADTQQEVVKKYGVWGRKKMMGREYDGIFRTSFLIAPEGTIVKIYENVKPEGHAEEVLADVKAMG